MGLRIGFIGVGGIAQRHLQSINGMRGAEVAAVCDIDCERAATVGEKFNAAVFTDWKKMLSTAAPDAVYICVIPSAHKTMELELAKAGIPFWGEKPVHLSLATAKRVAAEVDRKNLVTAAGYHWRAMGQVKKARSFLSGKKVSLVQGWWYGGMPGVWWWRRKKESGGQHIEQTTHIYDLARYLAGDVDKVYAAAGHGAMTDVEDYDVEDVSTAVLEFKSGAVGTITSGCISAGTGKSQVGIRMDGKGWTLEFLGFGALRIAKKGKPVEFVPKASAPFEAEDKAFAKAVKSGDVSAVYCDYNDAVKSLAVTLAVDNAIKTGRLQKVAF